MQGEEPARLPWDITELVEALEQLSGHTLPSETFRQRLPGEAYDLEQIVREGENPRRSLQLRVFVMAPDVPAEPFPSSAAETIATLVGNLPGAYDAREAGSGAALIWGGEFEWALCSLRPGQLRPDRQGVDFGPGRRSALAFSWIAGDCRGALNGVYMLDSDEGSVLDPGAMLARITGRLN